MPLAWAGLRAQFLQSLPEFPDQRSSRARCARWRVKVLSVVPWSAGSGGHPRQVVTIEEVRAFASQLPRAYEALVRDRVKFRVGRIVFLAFSRDEQVMGFGFPKEERAALVASEPGKFSMPGQSDLRYHWVHVRLAAIDQPEMEELVLDAWRMCVPKKVAASYLAGPAQPD